MIAAVVGKASGAVILSLSSLRDSYATELRRRRLQSGEDGRQRREEEEVEAGSVPGTDAGRQEVGDAGRKGRRGQGGTVFYFCNSDGKFRTFFFHRLW